MQDNKVYLNKMPVLFLMLVAGLILREAIMLLPLPASTISNQVNFYASELIDSVLLFVPLGLASGKWKKVLICIIASIVVSIINSIGMEFVFSKPENRQYLWLVFSPVQLLSLFISLWFFIESSLSVKKILLILSGLIIFRGATVIFYFPANIFKFFHLSESGLNKYIGMFSFIVFGIARFIFFCEMQNLADGKAPTGNVRLINPGNNYNKLSATISFLFLKLFIVFLVLGLGYSITSMLRYREYDNEFSIYRYFGMTNSFFAVGVVLGTAWWLRKFLLEYFISHNITSKFNYWLLLLPFVGMITWLVNLQEEQTDDGEKRINNINDFAAAPSIAISTIVFIAMGLLMLVSILNTGSAGGGLVMLFSVILFIWFINHSSAYYFNFYVNLVLYCTMLIWFAGAQNEYYRSFAVMYPYILFSLWQLILIFPIYHFTEFTYVLPLAEEVVVHDARDLLPEFQ